MKRGRFVFMTNKTVSQVFTRHSRNFHCWIFDIQCQMIWGCHKTLSLSSWQSRYVVAMFQRKNFLNWFIIWKNEELLWIVNEKLSRNFACENYWRCKSVVEVYCLMRKTMNTLMSKYFISMRHFPCMSCRIDNNCRPSVKASCYIDSWKCFYVIEALKSLLSTSKLLKQSSHDFTHLNSASFVIVEIFIVLAHRACTKTSIMFWNKTPESVNSNIKSSTCFVRHVVRESCKM